MDWNNDGKKDVVCGGIDGLVKFILNTNTDAFPLLGTSTRVRDGAVDIRQESGFNGDWKGASSVPVVVDWDNDGKKDLLVGNAQGRVLFYRNQGTDAAPLFNGFTNLLAGGAVLDVGSGWAHPVVADWDGDGVNDLIVGTGAGGIRLFHSLRKPKIVYDRVALDDAGGGNGDGVINPGETVKLLVSLRNLGLQGATGVVATASCADGYVTVTDNSAAFGEIPGTAGTEGKPGADPFEIRVAGNCPTPRQVKLVLQVTDELSNVWTVPFQVMVYTSCRISGVVTLDGAPAAGVTIEYAGTTSGTSLTDSQGAYTFAAIDGTYTLVGKKTGWLDSAPLQATVPPDRSGADFAFLTAKVAGMVTDWLTGNPLPGATVDYTGALTGTVTSGSDGRYEFTRVYGQATTLTVTARKAGYFDSSPRSVAVPPDDLGVDFAMSNPDIDVTPVALDVTGVLGETLTRTLRIRNLGLPNLGWTLNKGGGVVRKFDLPVASPGDAAFDGSALWVLEWGKINKFDPATGALLGKVNLNSKEGEVGYLANGLDWDGTNLWVANSWVKKVYALDPATGQPVKTLTMPKINGSQIVPYNVAVGGGYIWLTGGPSVRVAKLDPATGALISWWNLPAGVDSRGPLEYFHGAIWMVGGTNVFKLNAENGQVLDCGLLGALIDVPARIITLGDASFAEYNGAFVENFVASELARKYEGALHYWISEGIAEVNFIVVYEEAILPLEVKSGMHRAVKSLWVFADKFNSPKVYRTSPRNFECRDRFANIPLYAIGLFPQLR